MLAGVQRADAFTRPDGPSAFALDANDFAGHVLNRRDQRRAVGAVRERLL